MLMNLLMDHANVALGVVQTDEQESLECFESCVGYDPTNDVAKEDPLFIHAKDTT